MSWLEFIEHLKDWLHASATWFEAYGLWGLALLAIAESSFFPVPPDTVLIPLVGNSLDKGIGWTLILALVCTLSSVFGSWIGYAIGVWGGRPVLNKIVRKPEKIARAEEFFERYGAWAVAIAGFTPIPYKVFAISGGVFRVDLLGFTLGGLLGRGLRFFLVALAIYHYGEQIKENLDIIFMVSLVVVVTYAIYLVIRSRRARKLADPAGAGPAVEGSNEEEPDSA